MAAGIFAHSMTAGRALSGSAVSPKETSSAGTAGTNSSSSSSGDSSTISANDFLTLLVTEMQNQDPTADTDPNAYINQLVEVNSLEQLIDINQTLATDTGAASSGASTNSASVPGAEGASNQVAPVSGVGAAARGPSDVTALESASKSHAATTQPGLGQLESGQPESGRAPGNLSIPAASAASQRVAHALDRPSHAKPIAGRLAAFEKTSLNK